MSFGQSIQKGFRNYAEFSGRASRPEFWWWILFTVLVSAALGAIPVWDLNLGAGVFSPQPTLTGLWNIAVLLPTLGVTVRRLRDAGYGWANVFWILLPLAGFVVLVVLCAQPAVPRATRTGNAPGMVTASRTS